MRQKGERSLKVPLSLSCFSNYPLVTEPAHLVSALHCSDFKSTQCPPDLDSHKGII